MEENLSKRLYKIELCLLKILPIILAFIYLLNTVLSYFYIDLLVLSFLGGMSLIPLIFMYISSYVFGFCLYHRMFLNYIVVNDLLNTYDYYIGIPLNDLQLLCTHLIITGIFLFIILYLYVKDNKRTVAKNSR